MGIAKFNKRNKSFEKNNIVKQTENINMLYAIEKILNATEDSSLSPEYIEPLEPYLKYISDLQSITSMQAILLSIFLEGSSDDSFVSISDVARYLDCTNVRVMQFQEDIDYLVKRRFLRRTKRRYGNDKIGYSVPKEVVNAFKSNSRFVPKSMTAKNGIHFFQMVFDLTHQRKEGDIDTEQLKEDFQLLLEANEKLRYVKKLEGLNLPLNSKLIVTQMARHLVIDHDDHITLENLTFLFDDRNESYDELHNLEDGDHILMRKKLVEFDGKDGFLNSTRYKLTDIAIKKLLKGFNLPKKTDSDVQTIKADKIAPKSLFFNEEIGQQMEVLTELLTVEKLTAIQTRLKEHGRRTGFACLFYGAPGTGKTESVLQIARKTGRDIMQVDISEIKSKWVGESEQNIKAVFENYRSLCKHSEKIPILLFNEADAILGTRIEQAFTEVDKMENAIQNNVLQEMETLDGIMIATTNLEQSLDSAFERRFIYKVRFARPDIEQRRKIWLSMFPSLSEDTALQLATAFDLSGGQIENIVRKCDVESILYGDSAVDSEKIQRFCQEEKIHKTTTSHIGFL